MGIRHIYLEITFNRSNRIKNIQTTYILLDQFLIYSSSLCLRAKENDIATILMQILVFKILDIFFYPGNEVFD